MLSTSAVDFAKQSFQPIAAATAKQAFFVAPDGFALSSESATDNAYMDLAQAVDPVRALAQHRELVKAIDTVVPVNLFRGDASTPDAVFCNNAWGTVLGKLIVGAMHHPQRRRETRRRDILDFFARRLGYPAQRLDRDPSITAELTGPLVIDRARNIGYCGLSERCNLEGARAMHAAFGLAHTFVFDLAPGEYHTNVVLAVLAGRAAVLHEKSFARVEDASAIAAVYGPHVAWLDDAEKAAFCANCIALSDDVVWMSARADRALRPENRTILERAGFQVRSVEIDEIEKAGGSLRCCVGEIF
jgi:hypothetical protein